MIRAALGIALVLSLAAVASAAVVDCGGGATAVVEYAAYPGLPVAVPCSGEFTTAATLVELWPHVVPLDTFTENFWFAGAGVVAGLVVVRGLMAAFGS